MTADPQRTERSIDALKKLLTVQAADMANAKQLPAATVASVYLEVAVALALIAGTQPHDVVTVLRNHADRVEREAGGAMASRN